MEGLPGGGVAGAEGHRGKGGAHGALMETEASRGVLPSAGFPATAPSAPPERFPGRSCWWSYDV